MKRRIKVLSSAGLALALLVGSAGAAHARGLLLDASELAPEVRAALVRDAARARVETPVLARQVDDVIAHAKATDDAARLPGMPMTRAFRGLGPRALPTLLERLALDAHLPADVGPRAERALLLGLVEAAGMVRDERALPVLERALTKAGDAELTRALVEALARIGTDRAAHVAEAVLARTDAHDEARVLAILDAMGTFKRLDVTRLLASRLDAGPSDPGARTLCRALGRAANAWAWRTLSDRHDEQATRALAARSLLGAFVRHEGDVRQAAEKALLIVDAPDMAVLLAEARRTSPNAARSLDALSAKLRANPTR